MGKARCSTFSARLNGGGGDMINLEFLQSLQQLCATNTTLAELDHTTPTTFDNGYFTNILSGEGLLASDQALLHQQEALSVVQSYARDAPLFFHDFAKSMIAMGGLQNGLPGEIRRNCRALNQIQF